MTRTLPKTGLAAPTPLVLALVLCSWPAPPAAAAASSYTPASRLFSCLVPDGWTVVEESVGDHAPVHFLGPDDPFGLYRTGIDVHYYAKGDPGYISAAAELRVLRRQDPETDRTETAVRSQRVAGAMALTFEVTESRWLPLEGLPSAPQVLHRYVALIPEGSNYYVVTLSSLRFVYLDFKDTFGSFLKSFQSLQSGS